MGEAAGKVEFLTDRPDFDRLVNTWLPYELYASRLWGRVGPTQRAGATGYRDQLQDSLPLVLLTAPDAGADRVHASQQVREGDVLEWRHRAPGGGRPSAAHQGERSPSLCCPMCWRAMCGTG